MTIPEHFTTSPDINKSDDLRLFVGALILVLQTPATHSPASLLSEINELLRHEQPRLLNPKLAANLRIYIETLLERLSSQ